jgi:hypothetical protein
MTKKYYGKSNMEIMDEQEFFNLREMGYDPEEALDIVKTKQSFRRLFGFQSQNMDDKDLQILTGR